jgi:hypothetical protein
MKLRPRLSDHQIEQLARIAIGLDLDDPPESLAPAEVSLRVKNSIDLADCADHTGDASNTDPNQSSNPAG